MAKSINKINESGKEYLYEVSLSYNLGSESTDIESARIAYLSIVRNYDSHTEPMIFMILNLQLDLYEKIIKKENIYKGEFSLFIQKKLNGNSTQSKRNYIKSSFRYFVPTNMNTKMMKNKEDKDDIETNKKVIVGLLNTKLHDKSENANIYNGFFTNATNLSLAHYVTKGMKMVFEPFTNIEKIDSIYIPPIDTSNSFLSYLNSKYPFYNTPYRYFKDFDLTYLLSENGTYVDKGDNQYPIINIDVVSTDSILTDNYKGIIINDETHMYYLYINVENTHLKVDRYAGYSVNNIMGFNSNENNLSYTELDLEYNDSINYNYQRVENDLVLKQEKRGIENNTVNLLFAKSDIDSSIITPNKQYIVNNYKNNSDYDGNYILSSKTENFSKYNGDFIMKTEIKLRKVK